MVATVAFFIFGPFLNSQTSANHHAGKYAFVNAPMGKSKTQIYGNHG
jgi:hypothetical protein